MAEEQDPSPPPPETEASSIQVDEGYEEVANQPAIDTPAIDTPTIAIEDATSLPTSSASPFPDTPGTLEPASESQPSPRIPDQAPPSHTNGASLPNRNRADSQSTIATTTTQKSTRSSLVFVTSALEAIAASKDARKNKKLGQSTQRALAAIKLEGHPGQIDPEVLFEPLQLAADAQTVQVVTTALDCIGKLISYSYFAVPTPPADSEHSGIPLIERAIDTICDCFQSEATPVETQLQIVKSLLAAILNDKIVVHGAGLLKAVRLIYNIFLLSKSTANQQVAQGALTQMVGIVFERVKGRLELKEARLNTPKESLSKTDNDENGEIEDDAPAESKETRDPDDADTPDSENVLTSPSDEPVEKHEGQKITLQSFENRKSFDDAKINDNAPTLVTRLPGDKISRRTTSGSTMTPGGADNGGPIDEDEEDEIYIKDAYLVFRAMCRLSTKSLPVEQAHDVKSQSMRSKLLSLHIIHNILYNHALVVTSPLSTIKSSSTDEPTSFVQAIKQYLCLSLSRNGASSVNRVFEVSVEIFWLMVKHLRVMLKKEIEVFMKEIYFAILDKRAAPAFQKMYILHLFEKLAADPRALVEIFLNYDCDRTALDNVFQKVVEHLSRISTTPVSVTSAQELAYHEHQARGNGLSDWHHRGTLPPSLSTAAITASQETEHTYPIEYAMKEKAFEDLMEILRSLVLWSQQSMPNSTPELKDAEFNASREDLRSSIDTRDSGAANSVSHASGVDTPVSTGTSIAEDDPGFLEKEKQRKTALVNSVRQFNFKPKRGIKALLKDGFIKSDDPQDIARFLLGNNELNKVSLGEYLGEGEPENIAIMHAYVDAMDFRQTRFVDALRRFLQSFRLPGEAQKIDRFMLKFAERYIGGNPKAFANADTAYVLAYSVIMLNTDQHSIKMKGARMTPEDFIKNNRGINDNADLPDDYLRGIYDEIAHHEIVLDTERETAANLGQLPTQPQGLAANIGQAITGSAKEVQREMYMLASEEITNRTEQLYKRLMRLERKNPSKWQGSKFIPASSFKHVRPMFQVTWMSFLTALAGHIQETMNLETIRLCMEGQKLAIRIACFFDLEDPRQAFVASLGRSTNLYNLSEMKAKNVEALKALLEVAHQEGDLLKESWRDVLTCISQLDRFQLIATGVDEGAVPDVLKKAPAKPQTSSRKSLHVPPRGRQRSQSGFPHYQADIAEESRSADMIRSVDRIFTNTANLSGEAIVYFVRALCQVSWQEIQSSGLSESPRTYSLQKLVEISAYNMTRVRFEWTNIWQVLGAHFNQVGCHNNTSVVFFALDSLRQLSMKFLELEELPGFKFQKDFLKPFEHIMGNSTVVPVKDMVLRCLIQMIQARGENIRSGWRTMFGVFTVAAREPYEGIVNMAYDNVTKIYNDRFGIVISQGAFADLIVCLTQFSKNMKFQKKSLQAIEALKASVLKMLKTPECPLSQRTARGKDAAKDGDPKVPLTSQTQEEQFWFPVLFAFHDVLMTGEDLEVRSRALNYLFETLTRYGGDFPADFWDTLWRQLLYPIFMVLKSKSEMSKVVNHEELSVWLSTTMIQALRNMIALFTHFFDSLEYMLDRFLDLLALCICQENDTLARIGSNCLQQLVAKNVNKFTPEHWRKIVDAFVELFTRTEATALFSAATLPAGSAVNGTRTGRTPSADTSGTPDLSLNTAELHEEQTPTSTDSGLGINGLPNASERSSVVDDTPRESISDRPASPQPTLRTPIQQELEDFRPENEVQQPPVVVTAARRRFFNQIITKCVLQLLMIETVHDLFTNDDVYSRIPSPELLRLMGVLKKSYHFAKRFNEDRELRGRLFREGFMKQPPNLLKQESGSASVYVSILFRMYADEGEERAANRASTEHALIPLCVDIVQSFAALDDETQQRNIVTWRPVVVDVVEGYAAFPAAELERHMRTFAPLLVGLMGREMGMELQRAVQGLLARFFEGTLGIEMAEWSGATPVNDRSSVFGGRRGSRGR
ncbi:protein transport protein sec72 [Eremomyces bilateralis CBS 781.70]|uniref:Protein transport protein sec72 n=1 Tax=Eremomyces bilateralis CBS 781.70 TaxID=1392243 RepID=A0A6G1G195_9PEZI|nr:protein transport protein sec72 [Eremomyces bilateralis CBS 781.70]KAF1811579.1 protein transport protein sec72 [Eremomyces bilateralis CBS 781.70]